MRGWCFIVGLTLVACADNAVVVTIEGSPRTLSQIPHSSDEADGLQDGYTVTIEKLLLVLSNVEVKRDGVVKLSALSARVWNAKKIGAHELLRADGVRPGRYDELTFEVAPASIARSGNADAADVERMMENRYAVYVEGVATKKFIHAFRWGFDRTWRFEECAAGVDASADGVTTMPLVVQGERIFLDNGFAPFRNADRNDNRYTTVEELEAAKLRGAVEASIGRLFGERCATAPP